MEKFIPGMYEPTEDTTATPTGGAVIYDGDLFLSPTMLQTLAAVSLSTHGIS